MGDSGSFVVGLKLLVKADQYYPIGVLFGHTILQISWGLMNITNKRHALVNILWIP